MSEQHCTCPIRPNMSKQELLDEIYIPQKNCCHPHHICRHLDREMRRAEKEASWKKYQSKKLKRAGFTDEDIKRMPRKKKGAPAIADTWTNVLEF